MARRGRNDRVQQAARRRRVQGAALSGGAILAGQLTGIGPAQAVPTNFVVTNLNDSGVGSLRAAVQASNATPADNDTISFMAGLTGTITLTTGSLKITDDVVVTGPGAATITVDGNDASTVFYVYSPSQTIDVTISGLTVSGGAVGDASGDGGGIGVYDEHVTLDHMVISGNAADQDGAGVFIDGPSTGAVGRLSIADSTITGNTAGDEGGGVSVEDADTVSITRTQVTGNTATLGGGIDIDRPLGTTTILDSTISGNTGAEGRGINLYEPRAAVTIERTTVSGNLSNGSEAGGGIFVLAPLAPVLIVDSTISGNSAGTGYGGGVALYFESPGLLSIEHTTITANTAYGGGGVWNRAYHARIALDHTIVAGNTVLAFGPDLAGEFNDAWSLIGNTAGANLHPVGGTSNVLNVSAQLGPLANHGGLTQTHLPSGISPALNAGDPAFAAPPTLDQRGMPRKLDTRIDIGAVELYPTLPGRVAGSIDWLLRDTLLAPNPPATSATSTNFLFGSTPLVPLSGDWDGDGDKSPGSFRAGTFFLYNGFNSGGATNSVAPFAFGDSRGFPVAGDFDGDGRDDVAVYRNGTWQVRFTDDAATTTFTLGPLTGNWPAVVPVAGDWNGDGVDGIGIYQAGTWTLRNLGGVTGSDQVFTYNPGTSPYPVVGDWDGDGDDTVGVKSATGSLWQVRNTNTPGAADYTFDFGAANHLPITWQLRESPETTGP